MIRNKYIIFVHDNFRHTQRFQFEGTEEELKASIEERKARVNASKFLGEGHKWEYAYQTLDEFYNNLPKAK